MPGHTILALLEDIRNDIESAAPRSHATPSDVKLLSTLQVFASGSCTGLQVYLDSLSHL